MMHSALLQHSGNRNILLSFMSASPLLITLFHNQASFKTCALKSPKTVMEPLGLTLRNVALISSTNSGHSSLEFRRMLVPNTGSGQTSFNLNINALPPRGILSSIQPGP